MSIGKIKKTPLRDVWKHEAHDFTKWLVDNIDVINDATGLSLSSVEREQSAGSFNVDLIAEDPEGCRVVIENQLERSDHSHLGQLITYLTVHEASTAIWIVQEARPEHTAAMSWLNKTTDVNFYLLQAEAISIDDSEPALLLTRIIGPSAEIKSASKNQSDRHHIQREFWTTLLERAKKRTKLHSTRSPGNINSLGIGAGISWLNFNYVIASDGWRVELYFNRASKSDNKWFFDQLQKDQAAIENEMCTKLSWLRMDDKKSCRIAIEAPNDGGCKSDLEEWPDIQDRMIQAMIPLHQALASRLEKMPANPPHTIVSEDTPEGF
ncbi:hypothetical protein COB72_06345 [bacterium]|nr:MAG: hypothetical protein COB72_06345 [bacterium]